MWTTTHERITKVCEDLKELSLRVYSLESREPSEIGDSKTLSDVLRRLESLEQRFAALHARLTETTVTGKERLSSEGKRAKFLFGGAP